MCLRALENMAGERPWNMLDVGTGSGILAIYSAILGANRIVAIDIDPEALRWARRNAMLNGRVSRGGGQYCLRNHLGAQGGARPCHLPRRDSYFIRSAFGSVRKGEK
ncbi:MAG: 50S ribosomal protein L11 methyltransferase [Deltaproteobacteria bacterium]|nr:50S ribosomal protein L11 methyltransferase [Deltaproteobacteria bacterium]